MVVSFPLSRQGGRERDDRGRLRPLGALPRLPPPSRIAPGPFRPPPTDEARPGCWRKAEVLFWRLATWTRWRCTTAVFCFFFFSEPEVAPVSDSGPGTSSSRRASSRRGLHDHDDERGGGGHDRGVLPWACMVMLEKDLHETMRDQAWSPLEFPLRRAAQGARRAGSWVWGRLPAGKLGAAGAGIRMRVVATRRQRAAGRHRSGRGRAAAIERAAALLAESDYREPLCAPDT